jgi:glycerol uptake facilitator-like aquaporin
MQECGTSPPLGAMLWGEFAANIIFAFGAIFSSLAHNDVTGILVSPISLQNKLFYVPFVHGMALVVAVAMFVHLGVAHCNPMVTLAFAMLHSISWWRALQLWFMQFFAWVVVGLIALGIYGQTALAGAKPAIGAGHSSLVAFFAEALGAFILVLVVLMYQKRFGQTLAIGMGLFVPMAIFLQISGAALNQLRWFIPTLISNTYTSEWWVWLFGPLLGAFVAYGFFAMRFDKYGGFGPPECEVPCAAAPHEYKLARRTQ